MGIRSFLNNRNGDKAVKNVNVAVGTLSKFNLGFSPTGGLVGDTAKLGKSDFKKINRAVKTMNYYSAGYFTKTVTKKADDFKAARYAPLKFADYRKTQEKVLTQLYSSSHLRSAITAITRTLYDTRIQSEINRYDLGLTPEESQEWVKRTERIWRMDKDLKSWDYYFQNNYAQVADMAKLMYIGIGEFFAILRSHSKDETRKNNISIQLISPFQVQTPFTGAQIDDGNYVDQGIEFNEKGVEIAIHVAPAKSGEEWKRIAIHNENGFKQVIHGFIQKEPGQTRGIPDSAKSWHEFMSIADMLSFEMDSAKINSSISGSVSASDANAAPTSRANLDNLGRSAASGGAGWGNGAETPEELTGDVTYDVREVPAGGFIVQNLPPGYQYKEHDTKRPNVNIPNFIEKDLDYIFTANFGISVGVVTQVLEGSYNASKAKIDLSWKRAIEYYLKQFESDFDRDIYRSWVASKVGTGDIIVFDWFKKRESWLGMRAITPTKPSLNPLVDARTADLRTSNGTSNHEYESQLYNGTSYSENIERLNSENETLKIARDKLENQE